MSVKMITTNKSSTSTPSARSKTRKIQKTLERQDASPTPYGKAEIELPHLRSPLADIYETEEFRNDWENDVRLHVSRNILYLRRYRKLSQKAVAKAIAAVDKMADQVLGP